MRTPFLYSALIPSCSTSEMPKLLLYEPNERSRIKEISGGSSDVLVNEFTAGGVRCALLSCDGMVSTSVLTELVFEPLMNIPPMKDSSALIEHIQKYLLLSTDRPEAQDYGTFFRLLNSGFAILIAQGVDRALAFGAQGYESRGIQEPSGEGNLMGAHEGFSEVIRTNMSQIRRRLKTPELVMELFIKGDKSETNLCLCYMKDRVPKRLMQDIRRSLGQIKLESILSTESRQRCDASKGTVPFQCNGCGISKSKR